MFLRKYLYGLIGIALLTLQSNPVAAAQTIKLTAVAGFPPFLVFVKIFEEVMVPGVDKRLAAAGGKYKIEWTRAYGGAIAKEENTLEAIEDGLGDLGFVPFIFEQSKLPLLQVSYVAPFVSANPALLHEVQEEMHRTIPALNASWHRQKQIYLVGTTINSFQVFSRKPFNAVADLKGLKIGLAGPLAAWIKGTGAVPVNNPITEGYTALKSGVIDADIIFPVGAFAFKLYEPAPHVVKVNLGAAWSATITFNKKRWEGLPAAVRKAFKDTSLDYSMAYRKAIVGLGNHVYAEMSKKGAKVTEFPEAERKKWVMGMPNVAQQWAAPLESKGLPAKKILAAYIDGVRKRGGKIIRDWSK